MIRRNLGAFTVAAAVAAGLALNPVNALAATPSAQTGTTTSSSLVAFCLSLDAQIAYTASLSVDDSIKVALLAPLEGTRNTFCYNVIR